MPINNTIDNEKVKQNLAHIIDRIRTNSDRSMLEEYRKTFKREIAFFHRSTVGAYLFMLYDQGKMSVPGSNFAAEDRGRRKAAAEKRPSGSGKTEDFDNQHYPLAEEESLRLFFSVGRSRRVFPREILGLITAKTAVSRDDIGVIRILDNYSFIQVRNTIAEELIQSLNGITFRGRPLTVNYAKSRKDSESDLAGGLTESGAAGGDTTETFAGKNEDESDYSETAELSGGDPAENDFPSSDGEEGYPDKPE